MMGKTTDCLAPADNESAQERKKRTDVLGILVYPRQTCFQEDKQKMFSEGQREKISEGTYHQNHETA